MSTISYNVKSKGVRLVSAEKAWVKGKNGKMKLNPDYHFVGKMEMSMPNLIISARDNKKPIYKDDTSALNLTAKKQIVSHFYDNKGKRNKKTVAYFGVEKKKDDDKKSYLSPKIEIIRFTDEKIENLGG